MSAIHWPRRSRNQSGRIRTRAVPRVGRGWEPLEERIAPASLIVVDSLLDGGNPSGTTTLRQAIDQANADPGSSISFSTSLFDGGPQAIPLTAALPELIANMTISGPGSAVLAIRGGGPTSDFSVLRVAIGVTAALDGLTITGAHTTSLATGGAIDNTGHLTLTGCTLSSNVASNGNGGGLFNHGGDVTLTGSTISGNTAATHGGGIYNYGGTLALVNCTISGNTASRYGGGVYNHEGRLTFTGTSISGNTGGTGGGIFTYTGDLAMASCSMTGNTANVGAGGGLFNTSSTTINDCTIASNAAAGNGGGIHNGSAQRLLITRSTLFDNASARKGGALYNLYDPVTLTNCTVTGNRAQNGGIANDGTMTLIHATVSANRSYGDNGGGILNTRNLTLFNTIVANNFAQGGIAPGDLLGLVDPNSAFNLIGDGDDLTGLIDGDQGNRIGTAAAPIDPMLVSPTNNGGPTLTMALLPGSPALDRGAATIPGVSVPTIDQRGALRGTGGLAAGTAPDIGAFEASSSYLVTSTSDDANTVGTLRDAFGWANLSTNAGPDAVTGTSNTIVFDTAGTFATAQTLTPGFSFAIENTTTPVSVSGPGASMLTLQGGGPTSYFSVIRVSNGVLASVSGLTITGGRSNVGGGILSAGNLTVLSCAISGNTATSSGGGIYSHGNLRLVNSTVAGNYARYSGGGIQSYPASSTLAITNCTISGNSTGGGGGGVSNEGAARITGSTLADNTAEGGGGAIRNTGALKVLSSTLSGNTAGDFGGAMANTGTLDLVNCTVSGNSGAYGGAAWVYTPTSATTPASMSLTNVTVAGNRSTSNEGGGIDVLGNSLVKLNNTLVAGNFTGPVGSSPGDVRGALDPSGASNLIGDGDDLTGIADGSQGNRIGTAAAPIDARLGPLADNGGPTLTMALLADSPAIGNGDVALAIDPVSGSPLGIDQRGFPRTVEGRVDIGAIESPPASALGLGTASGVYNGTATLTATLISAGMPVSGAVVAFSLVEGGVAVPVGVATTDASGLATLPDISLAGLVAGLYPGAVSATYAGDLDHFGSTASADLTVGKAPATLQLVGPLTFTYDGSPHTVDVATIPAGLGGVTVIYTRAGSAVAAPTDAGNYSVVASLSNPNYTAVDAANSLVINRATPTIAWASPADITYGTALGSAQLDATASFGGTDVPGTFDYSPAAGSILDAGAARSLSVNFTPTDTVNFEVASATTTINVLKATPTITWATPADITYGTALGSTQLDATASFAGAGVPGTFTYTPASGTLLDVGAAQILSTSFTPTDAANFNPTSSTTTINVLKATPTINWASPADITYGTALGSAQLDATASFSGAGVPGQFVYAPAAGTVLGAGLAQVLSVTFNPADTANFNSSDATTTINVLRATPTLTWATPADITYGTALGSTQLDATASFAGAGVPGNFAYSPAAGTVLDAGPARGLSVTFTPTDIANFDIAATTTSITVKPAPLTVTVNDVSKIYGDPNPAFSARYGGFVIGQGPEALAGQLVFDTAADAFSHVRSGGYPVQAGGLTASNYLVTFAAGSLTVTPAPLTIAADNQSMTAGAVLPTLTATYRGLVAGDSPATLTTSVRLSTSASSSSAVGSYPIVADAAASPDYAIRFVDGTLTVNPTPIQGESPDTPQARVVTSLYRDVLGREPEPSGLRYWIRALARGKTPANITRAFFRSPERQFLKFLGIAPRINYETAWANALRSGRTAGSLTSGPSHRA